MSHPKWSILLIIVAIMGVFTTSFAQPFNGKLGFGLSPAGFPHDYSQILLFLEEVGQMCDGNSIVFQNGEWRDQITTSGIIPGGHKAVALSSATYGYTEMLGIGWGHYPSISLNVPGDTTMKWTNATARSLFLQMLINLADSLQPAYLCIGNEIDSYFENDSLDFAHFVSFYHEAYDSIKAHSPETKVGTNFNYEHLSGQGVLTGWSEAYWNAFYSFDPARIDFYSFTIYPFFNYTTANSIPEDYLNGIFDKTGEKPIVISETGWPADAFIGSWISSPEQQVDYVHKLFSLIQGKNVEAVNWLFLNYLMSQANDGFKIFCSVSLRDSMGNDRPALNEWLSYCATTSVDQVLDIKSFSVYPNPFTLETSLYSEDEMDQATLTLYNSVGQIVKCRHGLSGNKINLDREGLPAGLYVLTIVSDNALLGSYKVVITD